MKARKSTKRGTGFTLVEIFVVAIIFGILAAIVIPPFASASETARGNRFASQLQTIRSQLELAQMQHAGAYPDLVNDGWGALTTVTEHDAAYSMGNRDKNDVGPYLQQPPMNPFADVADQTSVAADTSAAWHYNGVTGEIFAVVPQATVQGLNLSANDTVSP